MKKRNLSITFAIIFILIVSIMGYKNIQYKKQFHFLVTISDELNKTFPMKVDPITRLEKTSVHDNELIYHYYIDQYKYNITAKDLNQIVKSKLITGICDDNIGRSILDKDALISYLYYDHNNNIIGKITIDKKDCVKKTG